MSVLRVNSVPGLPTGLPFALAGQANGVCFISGMPALNADGTAHTGTFEDEVAIAWHNVAEIAHAAGFSHEEFLYVQCAVADMDDYAALNAWWRSEFPDVTGAPARFTFQAALPFGCKVEFQAVVAHA